MTILETSLLEHYRNIRQYTESLCQPLHTEDYIPQAADFTSPPKWHLAHTTWFFEEMILKNHLSDYVEFNSNFGFLFNSYYQSIGERAVRNQRGLITRPSVDEVYAYRHHVDQHIEKLLHALAQHNNADTITTLLTLGIQHEQQHQELLLTDLKYTFSFNPTYPIYKNNFHSLNDCNGVHQEKWINIPEGLYEIGHNDSHKTDSFCFDNELGGHKVYLNRYSISTDLVSNKEYIEFINSGGYQDFRFWLDEGWAWVNNQNITCPLYWKKINSQWFQYTLAGLQEIDPNAITTHISYYEASAFAAWREQRLPTEFEWEVASSQLSWGKRWEWTSSSYQPYPNFQISNDAVGEYNGKFMVNQMVLRGASIATSPQHSRHTYRNFFHPHFQWQYTGIRLAKHP